MRLYTLRSTIWSGVRGACCVSGQAEPVSALRRQALTPAHGLRRCGNAIHRFTPARARMSCSAGRPLERRHHRPRRPRHLSGGAGLARRSFAVRRIWRIPREDLGRQCRADVLERRALRAVRPHRLSRHSFPGGLLRREHTGRTRRAGQDRAHHRQGQRRQAVHRPQRFRRRCRRRDLFLGLGHLRRQGTHQRRHPLPVRRRTSHRSSRHHSLCQRPDAVQGREDPAGLRRSGGADTRVPREPGPHVGGAHGVGAPLRSRAADRP